MRAKGAAAKRALAQEFVQSAAKGPAINFVLCMTHFNSFDNVGTQTRALYFLNFAP